jgi:hypothetical protein
MAANPTDQFAVSKIFPEATLKEFNASPLVRSLTPTDFEALTKAFSIPPGPTDNPKIKQLTTHDLVSIEGLFADYRGKIIANFKGGEVTMLQTVAAGSSCCCCCTPCCSCCSAASITDPMVQ